ncbi:MAG: hypothetical protein MJZ33_09115 [Paludibacteraceae bacterium]|nr:hypothetical protein [Paludibacteraceae bacterium]
MPQIASAATHTDGGIDNEEGNRRVEQNIDNGSDISTLGSETENHLKQIMYGKEQHSREKEPACRFITATDSLHMHSGHDQYQS